ncbi:MAG: ABC transporter permease [Dehalococcoidia bacterium]|nr:ABC transporter permease [Dehalococcoidia bacterium]
MNIHRALAITRRIFRGLRRDRRTVALMFLAPIVAMCVFGLAFSGDVEDVKVVVVNLDAGFTHPELNVPVSFSQAIVSNFDKEVLKVDPVADVEEGVRLVREGSAYAVIIFPERFSESLYMKSQNPSYSGDTTIQVREDRSNVNVANAITKSVSDAILKTAQDVGQDLPMKVDAEDAIYGKGAKFMDFFVPGIMAFVVFMLTTLLTLISFVGERTSGNLERLQSTPLRESELVVGYAIAFSIIGMLQTVVLLVIGVAAFDIMIVGNIVLAFAVIALLAIVSLSLGILLSSLAKREAQAIQFFPLIVLPTFLLAGIFWPVEAIPGWLRPLSYAIPPSYAVDATRSVMLRGWGIGEIWIDIVALCGFAGAFLIVAILSLKRGRR